MTTKEVLVDIAEHLGSLADSLQIEMDEIDLASPDGDSLQNARLTIVEAKTKIRAIHLRIKDDPFCGLAEMGEPLARRHSMNRGKARTAPASGFAATVRVG